MDGLAVIDAVFFLIVVGYIGVPAVLRRIPADAEHDRRSALDEYGATNKAEFFAVATESFFEKPVQLERERPALYGQLREFYRQDPARRTPSIGT